MGASSSEGAPAEKLTIYTVNYPLSYFAERIGGDHVTVVFPAPADVDPAYWRPDAGMISDYQKADLIILNGAKYAKWVDKVSLSRMKIVNTSAAFKDRYIVSKDVQTHSHGPEGDHAHESTAFTTWLDFDLAAQQAQAVAAAMSRKRPELKEAFAQNYAALEKDLMALEERIKVLAATDPGRPLLASHPVYDYLAHRYGLNLKSLHWEPDVVPAVHQLSQLKAILEKHTAKWMIWEGDPLSESVEKLKSLGVRSLVFAPCGNRPIQGDFLSVMLQNVENLEAAYR